MNIIILIFFLIYIPTQFLHKEKIGRPSFLFVLLWGFIILLHSFGRYSLPSVGDEVYQIIFAGLLSFSIGSAIVRHVHIKCTFGKLQLERMELREKVFRVLNILFLAIAIIPTMKSISAMISGSSLYTIRYSLQGSILGDGIVSVLFYYFCEPYLVFLIVYSISEIFSEKKQKKSLPIAILGILLVTITSGGRFFILYFIGGMIIGFVAFTKKRGRKTEKKEKKKARFYIIVAVSAIIVVSIVREAGILQTMYVYLCGGMPFLEHLISKFGNGGLTNGGATLYGFTRLVFVLLQKLGICGIPEWLVNIEEMYLQVDQPYYLTPNILFNSFSTCFFAPYMDGGLWGVCLVFLILGVFAERAYRNKRDNDLFRNSWYLLFGLIVALSFFRLTITHFSFALSFVYLILVHKPTWMRKQS